MTAPQQPQKNLNLSRFQGKVAAPAKPAPPASPAAPALVSKERRIRDILASVDQLPSLPNVVLQIMQMANDPKSNAGDFETHIRKDQALTAKMLKLVNSSFFGLSNPVGSISRAIVLLGMKTLKSVVLAATTSKIIDRNLREYGYENGGLWKHSICTAATARWLAVKLKADTDAAENLFVAGLLHDIGKIILARHVVECQKEFDAALRANGGDLVAAEKAVIGISHAEVGGKMAVQWKLPDALKRAIENHHDGSIPDSVENRHLLVIRFADQLCDSLRIGLHDACLEKREIDSALAGALGWNDETLLDLTDELQSHLQEVQPVLVGMAN